MLNITKPSPNRINLNISGKIDSSEMKLGLDDLLTRSKDVSNGRMLYTVTDFEMPSIGALGVEITRLPQLFSLALKFDKVAVLSDVEWIRRWSEVEGAFLPGIAIKAYQISEKDDAEEWLSI